MPIKVGIMIQANRMSGEGIMIGDVTEHEHTRALALLKFLESQNDVGNSIVHDKPFKEADRRKAG